MTRQVSIVDSVCAWVTARIQECYRCCDCGESVSPWDEFCPTCGRGKPARVSTSAGVYLAIACTLMLLLVVLGAWLL